MRWSQLPLLALAILATSCTQSKKEAPAEAPLTRGEAEVRAAQLANVAYDLFFDLSQPGTEYSGTAQLKFTLKSAARGQLFVDFAGGSVKSVSVNGTPESKIQHEKGRILLRGLRAGDHQVEISFTHPYSTSGAGLHRFQDPLDQRVYTYTDLEPYDARHVFPCFDQPDLKAATTMKVLAPKEWTVISNVRESGATEEGENKTWTFPEGPKISTYIWALHAGPYQSWSRVAQTKSGAIPMRLFARRSEAKHVDIEDWFQVTAMGLDFYGQSFGYPYPFKKYDQLIVPEFNAGAMENVAAVTFSERYIFRSKLTQKMRTDRAEVILHEMAHMWFGDLVTMKWWNDLWLNESFATFSASWALEHIRGKLNLADAWVSFFNDIKEWAYYEDQLPTTHPILADVRDTDDAFALFDGITYGKGASVLKQVYFLLGDEAFKAGLKNYFTRHAYQNTTLEDFMSSLSEAAGKDLVAWQKNWLMSAGLNTVRTEWKCADEKLSEIKVIQNSPARLHKTQIGLWSVKDSKWTRISSIPVEYSENQTTVKLPEPVQCPDFVFQNDGDYDFIKSEIDPQSLAQVKASLGTLPDTLLRSMLWQNLWEKVTDGTMPAQEYAELALQHIGRETNEILLGNVLKNLSTNSLNIGGVLRYLPDAERDSYRQKISEYTWKQIQDTRSDYDRQLLWFQTHLRTAHGLESITRLSTLLNASHLHGLPLDQVRRWEVLQALARMGAPEIKSKLDAELKRDLSDFGKQQAVFAEAMIPDLQNKKEWFTKISRQESKDTPPLTFNKMRMAMRGYLLLGQESLVESAAKEYFKILPELAKKETESYVSAFSENLLPTRCIDTDSDEAKKFLRSHRNLPADVQRNIKIGIEENDRCIRARKKATEVVTAKPVT